MRVRIISDTPTHQLPADLTAPTEGGALRPVVDTAHPLVDIAGAHRALEAGRSPGATTWSR
ncbi:zinc-binding dehydrogenase [Streptomyces tsukubensis]|uniref:Uncharacterized protein n=1 Tax=Streptomyces tsukubensis TaxID=83656 RepID=A0A1V4A868_9ACTN|nr:hypothetical protein B1H18_17610 [Streptomyces tsukubensis]